MKKVMFEALNDQVNFELHSGYVYLQLSLIMEENNYKGYAEWLANHYYEELKHAQEIIKFLQERDQTPVLTDIKCPKYDITCPLEVAKTVYEHEQKVSERIYKLTKLAKENDDYASEIFLHSFIREQTEEENLTRDIIDRFTLAGDSVAARLYVDANINK